MKEEWKKNLMKEKHKHVFRQRFSFEKYGRGKERSKKKAKINIFWKKKRKKKIFPERTRLCFCQNVRIEVKHFQKGMVKHFRKCFKDMVRYGEKGGKGHLPESNQGEKKVVEMRRHWSGFTPKSHFTQHNSYYSCNLALHKPLWRIHSSFLFLFGWWEKASASRERHWPCCRCIALFGNSTVSEHSLLRELVFPSQTAMYCSVALRQVLAPPWAAR